MKIGFEREGSVLKKGLSLLPMHKYIHLKLLHRRIPYINWVAPGIKEINGDSSAVPHINFDSEEGTTTLCLQSQRQKQQGA
jgi:hypothetical protein